MPVSSKTLVARADAGSEIGIGHVMRCLALAQAWQHAGGDVIFVSAMISQKTEGKLRSEGIEAIPIDAAPGSSEDAFLTGRLCKEFRAAWLAVDGFRFSSDYCRQVRGEVEHLLLFDDHAHRDSYDCDVVLNTNPYACEEMYPKRDAETQFLLGAQFALLRNEFLGSGADVHRVREKVRRVLVTFGGSDPHNVTLKVIEALKRLPNPLLEVTVLVGADNQNFASLAESTHGQPMFRLISDPGNMPELMASADLAISAGGGTCYELAFLQVPMLLVIMAENHAKTVEAYSARRAAVSAGWFASASETQLLQQIQILVGDEQLRRELIENARRMVDGHGAKRVARAMTAHALSGKA